LISLFFDLLGTISWNINRGEISMEFLYLLAGIVVGVVSLRIYKRFIKAKAREKWENEKRIYDLVESSRDIIYYYEVKPERRFRYLSPSIEKVLGPGIVSESYKNPNISFDLIHPEDYEILSNKISGTLDYNKPIIQRWRGHQGNYIYFEEYATPIYKNGEYVGIQGIIRNIDEKVKLQEDLEYRSSHDSLTGIYNRSYFDLQMETYNTENDIPVTVILCDLDELKYVNDTLGHRTGDVLIKEAAAVLNCFSNDETIVSRIGGDEFAILVANQEKAYADNLVQEIVQALNHYNGENSALKLKVSIGYAYSESSLGIMSTLFVIADTNMYKDKKKKKTYRADPVL
jgi:diguanylate cyclase (GGDEF)-like protein/PAS domain S-box-containing protein